MLRWIAAYGVGGAVFLLVDLVWLSLMGPTLYRQALGEIMSERVNTAAAVAFYVIYVGGIVFLAVQPGLKAQSVVTAVVAGAVLGLVAYATYDLSNLATLKVWSLKVTVVDIAWGTALTAVAAGVACFTALRKGEG